jgi:hypothetical protein
VFEQERLQQAQGIRHGCPASNHGSVFLQLVHKVMPSL